MMCYMVEYRFNKSTVHNTLYDSGIDGLLSCADTVYKSAGKILH